MTTRTMVLGLLHTYGPMSGYEMQQIMHQSKTDLWAYIHPASIYHALKKLQQEGKVVLETIERTGLRSKAIFSLTTDGEKELSHLLGECFRQSSVVFPSAFYTALGFMEHLPREDVLAALEEQEREIRRMREEMKQGEREKEAMGEIPKPIAAALHNIYGQYALQLQSIQEIRGFLEDQK